jgi:hypothetical protein
MSEDSSLRKVISTGRGFAEEAWKKSSDVADKVNTALPRIDETVISSSRPLFSWFHQQRHERPWLMVGAVSTAAAVCSFPFGPAAAGRNTLLAALVTTCVVNPEYIAKVVRTKSF